MYHEATYQELRQRRNRRLAACAGAALACALAFAGYRSSRRLAIEQGATSLRKAVMDSAIQCCAIEGSFPSMLRHLEEHYGLAVNGRDYRVSYEWLGDNVAPSVVVRTQ